MTIRYYLGNINYDCIPYDLAMMLKEELGEEINSLTLKVKKGFAFFDYANEEKALALNGKEFMGRNLVCHVARERTVDILPSELRRLN